MLTPESARAQRLLAAWGLAVTAGYLLSQWLGSAGVAFFGLSAAGTLVALWVLLMAAPLALTFHGRKPGFHDGVWTGLIALGLAENAAVASAGGGHDHGAHGHGGSSSGASGTDSATGEAGGGHHASEGAQPGSAAPDEEAQPGASDEQAIPGAEQSGDGHAHPDGGHGPEGGSTDEHQESSTTGDASADGHHDSGSSDSEGDHGGSADGAGGGGGHGDAGGHSDAGGGGDAASIITGDVQHLSYYHLWFAIGAVGFLWSAVHAEGGARKALYGTAAALNAAMVAALVAYPPIGDAAGLIAAAVQGLPMLADLPLRRRIHAARHRTALSST